MTSGTVRQVAGGKMFQDRVKVVELRAATDFPSVPFFPSRNFGDGNACDLNLWMCPVLFCSDTGISTAEDKTRKLSVHQTQYK